MTAAARNALRRRPVAAAARLALIALLAAGLAGVTLAIVPARASSGRSVGVVTPGGTLLRSDYGWDWKHVVQVVANLRAKPPKAPLVVLLGGSSARECTVLDPDWTAQLQRRARAKVIAHNLGSKHRTYSQDLAFVKLLPRVPTIVYIGINLGRFCLTVQPTTVHLPPPGPLHTYSQHVYTRSRIQSLAQKRAYVAQWMQVRYPNFLANYAAELRVLEELIQTCKARGLHVVLLDLPRDQQAIGSSFNAPVGRFYAGCARLAKRYDIPWVHFVGRARLVTTDFYDIFHLVEPGRVKYQSLLSDTSVNLLRKYHMIGATPSPSPSPSISPSPSPSVSSSAPGSF